ncbi:MAG: hypothetical protein C4523_14710 [Myxococcales bacterium]|nr:MAG: hypothetical protein C4523_14710 [Myxococcales bacterium]
MTIEPPEGAPRTVQNAAGQVLFPLVLAFLAAGICGCDDVNPWDRCGECEDGSCRFDGCMSYCDECADGEACVVNRCEPFPKVEGCGDMSGLARWSPWPTNGFCQTRINRSPYAGPVDPEVWWRYPGDEWWTESGSAYGIDPLIHRNGSFYLIAKEPGGYHWTLNGSANRGWSSDAGNPYHYVLHRDGKLYYGSTHDEGGPVSTKIMAYNGTTSRTILDSSHFSRLASTILVDPDGSLYLAGYDAKEWGLGILLMKIGTDGAILWQQRFPGWDFGAGDLAMGLDGSVYLALTRDTEDYIFAYGPKSLLLAFNSAGEKEWEVDLTGGIVQPVVGADGTLYFFEYEPSILPDDLQGAALGEDGDQEYSWNEADELSDETREDAHDFLTALFPDGRLKWKTEIASGDWERGSPTSMSVGRRGTIYVAKISSFFDEWDWVEDPPARWLCAFKPDGGRKWCAEVPGLTLYPPLVDVNDVVYVGDSRGALFAINPDGRLKWKFYVAEDYVYPRSIGADGSLYVALDDGQDWGSFVMVRDAGR